MSGLEQVRVDWHDPLNNTNRYHEHDPHPDEFAEYLAGIFAVDEADLPHTNPPQHILSIPPFTKSELQIALRRLRKHKSADPRGVELEMLYYAPDELLDYLLELYNDLLRTGHLDPSWQHAEYLAGIFAVDEADLPHTNPPQHILSIPPFTKSELQIALRRLRKHKSADPRGVELEMLYYAPDELLDYLLELYNDLLRTGHLDPSWQHTLFTVLPKKGDRSRPSNWRPIASLKVLYCCTKSFRRWYTHGYNMSLIHSSLSTKWAFGNSVFDNVCARSLEYNCEIWVASGDLRQAFDRIHHPALFRALRHQGVSEGYFQLVQKLYSSQTGSVSDSRKFHIGRGVKQGDIISPLLFNAGLEHAIRE